MEYTTRTEELGRVTFSAPGATSTYAGHVWMQFDDGDRCQICRGGGFLGDTVSAYDGGVKHAAQRWLRQRRDMFRRFYQC